MAPYVKTKPQVNEKVERNEKLVQYKKDNPQATCREVGRLFRISGQAVSRIWRRAGIKYQKYGT